MTKTDSQALAIILSTRPGTERARRLEALRRSVCCCPECGSEGGVEEGVGRERACLDCGAQWTA